MDNTNQSQPKLITLFQLKVCLGAIVAFQFVIWIVDFWASDKELEFLSVFLMRLGLVGSILFGLAYSLVRLLSTRDSLLHELSVGLRLSLVSVGVGALSNLLMRV